MLTDVARRFIVDEMLIEEASISGFDRLEQLVRADGRLGLPAEELLAELESLGFSDEWQAANNDAANRLGFPLTDDELSLFLRYRNRSFLSQVAHVTRVGSRLSCI